MATSREYLDYILEQLSGLPEVTFRPMMGEYLLYCQGRLFGGVYDNRLLLKPVPAAVELLPGAVHEPPYPGAKELLLMEETDDRQLLVQVVEAMVPQLPLPKKRKK